MLQHVLHQHGTSFSRVQVIADQIPVKRRRRDIEKAGKVTLAHWSKETGVPYEVLFHSSKSELNLQIADYVNRAVFKKWERHDTRSYDLISGFVRSEFETFGSGGIFYY